MRLCSIRALHLALSLMILAVGANASAMDWVGQQDATNAEVGLALPTSSHLRLGGEIAFNNAKMLPTAAITTVHIDTLDGVLPADVRMTLDAKLAWGDQDSSTVTTTLTGRLGMDVGWGCQGRCTAVAGAITNATADLWLTGTAATLPWTMRWSLAGDKQTLAQMAWATAIDVSRLLAHRDQAVQVAFQVNRDLAATTGGYSGSVGMTCLW